MTERHGNPPDPRRSQRWVEGLMDLASRRGDSEAVGKRAADITRQLNIAPWVALGVAERIVALQDAPLLDRAARCEELQTAVLDKRLSMEQLKTTLPYAAHFLAVELVDLLGRGDWEQRKVTAVTEALLHEEQRRDEQGAPLPVRTRSLEEYAAAVRQVRRLVEQAGCSLSMAVEVAAGRLTEAYVQDYVAQRRRLVREELRQQAPVPAARTGYDAPRRYPADGDRRSAPQGGPYGAPRRERRSPPGRAESNDAGTP